MTTDELATATAEFDREFAFAKAQPLPSREHALHARARKQRCSMKTKEV